MKIKIDHINLTVTNMRESLAWYKNLFGFEFREGNLTDPQEPWAIVGNDDTMICLYEDPKGKPANEAGETGHHRIYHFGIRISDRKEWEDVIRRNKVEVKYGGAYQYPRSVSWYILDPSGHEIEVSWTDGTALTFA